MEMSQLINMLMRTAKFGKLQVSACFLEKELLSLMVVVVVVTLLILTVDAKILQIFQGVPFAFKRAIFPCIFVGTSVRTYKKTDDSLKVIFSKLWAIMNIDIIVLIIVAMLRFQHNKSS